MKNNVKKVILESNNGGMIWAKYKLMMVQFKMEIQRQFRRMRRKNSSGTLVKLTRPICSSSEKP